VEGLTEVEKLIHSTNIQNEKKAKSYIVRGEGPAGKQEKNFGETSSEGCDRVFPKLTRARKGGEKNKHYLG